MSTLKSNFIQGVKILSLALVLGLGIGILEAAWTPAPGTPPSGNPDAPINVGSSPQEKLGGVAFNTGGAPIGLVVATGNVGIGILDPAAKLEVGGTVRITGGSPTAGKSLVAVDNLGNATWQKTGFTNMQVFTTSSSWTTPPGVSRVMVEAWGGGAGGVFYTNNFGNGGTEPVTVDGRSGGASGAYAMAIINIPSPLTCTVVVGRGGLVPTPENPPLPPARDGEASSVECGFATVTAGGGSWTGARDQLWTPVPGVASASGVVASWGINGNFAVEHDGAAAPKGGGGGTVQRSNGGIGDKAGSVATRPGKAPGGGGAGGVESATGPSAGARGQVVIYW